MQPGWWRPTPLRMVLAVALYIVLPGVVYTQRYSFGASGSLGWQFAPWFAGLHALGSLQPGAADVATLLGIAVGVAVAYAIVALVAGWRARSRPPVPSAWDVPMPPGWWRPTPRRVALAAALALVMPGLLYSEGLCGFVADDATSCGWQFAPVAAGLAGLMSVGLHVRSYGAVEVVAGLAAVVLDLLVAYALVVGAATWRSRRRAARAAAGGAEGPG